MTKLLRVLLVMALYSASLYAQASYVSADTNYNPNSGLVGLHINQASYLRSPAGVSFDRDRVPEWEIGNDNLDRYFVLAYAHYTSAPLAALGYTTGDLFAVDKITRQWQVGPQVGPPSSDNPNAFFTINGLAPSIAYEILRLQPNGIGLTNTEAYDSLVIQRGGNVSQRWLRWSQGDKTHDWRIGMTVNKGSYDMSFFQAKGYATPSSPGTEYFRLSGSGLATFFGNITGGATTTLTLPAAKSTTGTRYLCITTTGLIVSSASACSGT
jgi:hypothetical protein